MKKRSFFSMVILALLLGLFVSPVSADPTSYTSTFQVINLESTDNTITVQFLDANGAEVYAPSTTIAANDSVTFTVADEPVTGGFDGSVIISAEGRIASSSNLHGLGSNGSPISYASYVAFSNGSSTTYLPLLMKNNYNYHTFVTVQNMGDTATDVTVSYSDGTTASITGLQRGASYKFDQSVENHSAAVFSGIATSTGNVEIGAVVVEVSPTTLFAYSSFTAGSEALVMPLVNENNYGYFTSINMQNLGDDDTTVTITYSPSMAGTSCTEVRTIAAHTSTTFAQHVFTSSKDAATFVSSTCAEGSTFIGTGIVTDNSANVPLAAIVNQLNSSAKKGAAYDAFSTTGGTSKVVFPLIMDRNWGYFTSWSIANLGASEIPAESISCVVKGKDINGSPVEMTFKNPDAIASGSGWTLNHQNVIANRFVGGAICTGPVTSQMVGSVNELQNSTIDSFLVYEGFNVNISD